MSNIFIEENGVYSIDCTGAVWASDKMNRDYSKAGLHINDVDFVIENSTDVFLAEYKNADIPDAVNPGAFNPMEDKKVDVVSIEEWNKDENYGKYPIVPSGFGYRFLKPVSERKQGRKRHGKPDNL